MAEAARINWTNATTLISVAIRGARSAGRRSGGRLGDRRAPSVSEETLTRAREGVLILAALTGLFYFLRAALAHEPIRG